MSPWTLTAGNSGNNSSDSSNKNAMNTAASSSDIVDERGVSSTETSLGSEKNQNASDRTTTTATHPETTKQQRHLRLRPTIALLPKAVVDQIAAGEVVQRPVSVVKELLENSLDAGATQIIVQFDGLSKLSIIDNGRGIPKKDLELLCVRHATSKLACVDDFSSLETFGFRGEALASTSMVSKLVTVVSRVRMGDYDDDNFNDKDNKNSNNSTSYSVAYSQSYKAGKPTLKTPRPCARKVGTTITIEDLFYNVPHRQKAYAKKDSEEYAKIHKVVQDYSVHYPTVGFVCQRKSKRNNGRSKQNQQQQQQLIVDCNTGQIPAVKALLQSRSEASKIAVQTNDRKEKIKEATKQILSQILESNLANHLLYMECGTTNATSNTNGTAENNNNNNNNNNNSISDKSQQKYEFKYCAEIYFTSPTYHSTGNNKAKQGKFVLFLNHRLVDLPPLKRSLEDIYADLGNPNRNKGSSSNSSNTKPVLVVNLMVPGCQVDVNVHPSKRQVALMHQEDLVRDICCKLKERLEEDGQAFVAQSVQTKPKPKPIIKNPYAREGTKRKRSIDPEDGSNENDDDGNSDTGKASRSCCGGDESNCWERPSKKISQSTVAASVRTPDTKSNPKYPNNSNNNSTAKKVAPSKLIRTNAAARSGAIEPFLVSTQTQTQTQLSLSQNSETSNDTMDLPPSRRPLSSEQQQKMAVLHVSTCPLSKTWSPLDMSQPGAFAEQLRRERCTCPTEPARRTVLIPNTIVKTKRVVPTPSKYSSIAQLRKRIGKQQCFETTTMIRKAFFMGVMSHQRSLIQCDEELVMVNHFELAKELFYQLALARFGGGAQLAHLGGSGGNGGIHIQTVIEQALQCEDELTQQYEKDRESRQSGDTSNIENNNNNKRNNSDLSLSGMIEVNDSNRNLAQHVTARLVESASMLDEYFSIRIEFPSQNDENGMENNSIDDLSSCAVLTGLPVLLEGHCPQPRESILL